MMDEQPISERLRGVVRAYAEVHVPLPESHPSPEDLQRYYAVELEPDRIDEIRDHLAVCPECSERLLFIADVELADEASNDDDLSGEVPEAVLRDAMSVLAAELGTRAEPRPALALERRTEPPRIVWFRRTVVTLAAAAVILLGVNIALLMRSPAGPVPRGDVGLTQLRPVDRVVRGDRGDVTEAALPAVVVLTSGEVSSLDRFEAELTPVEPADAAPALTLELERTPMGSFLLYLPAGSLEPGVYRIMLRGNDANGSKLLGRYEIRVLDDSARRQTASASG